MLKKQYNKKNFIKDESLLKTERILKRRAPVSENLYHIVPKKTNSYSPKKRGSAKAGKSPSFLDGHPAIYLPSTILLFNLFCTYLYTVYKRNNFRLSTNFINKYCKKKLGMSQNYLFQVSQQREQISASYTKYSATTDLYRRSEESEIFSFLKKKIQLPVALIGLKTSEGSQTDYRCLRQKNLFFFSCYRNFGPNSQPLGVMDVPLYFNKNIPSIYFFNYQNYIENVISSKYKTRTDLNFIKIKGFYKSAQFIVDEIIYFLEKRVPYNKIKGQIKRELLKSGIGGSGSDSEKGVRISYSGRLGGKTNKAVRKKIDTWSFGQTSLHILSSKVDFASGHAETKFGSAGIKVWVASGKN